MNDIKTSGAKDSENLKRWFERFKEFSITLNFGKATVDTERFIRLLRDFQPIQQNLKIEKKRLAPEYNIFSTLHIAHNEVFGHSAFLADLLDINGNHEQGSLFYDEFISQLNLPDKFKISEDIFFTIRTEVFFRINAMENKGNKCHKDNKCPKENRIDILIHYSSPKKRFGIAIENKIFAGDQPCQLERYSDYMKREYDKNFILLYLTRNGNPPTPESISPKTYLNLTGQGLLKLISYQRHITGLLENTIKEIEPEFLKFIINQYLRIIKNGFKNER